MTGRCPLLKKGCFIVKVKKLSKYLALILLVLSAICLYFSSICECSTAYAADTVVESHGRLRVSGSKIVDKSGAPFQLIGMSSHGLAWYPEAISEQTIKTLRDDWGCNAFRLAVYTEEYGGYTTSADNKDAMTKRVDNGVKIAKKLGMYVIIDWHILNDGNPQTHKSEALSFFSSMSKKYKDCENVIYEICNEPHGVSWTKQIKPYCIEVIKAIRKNDLDSIIICGSNTWSQDIHEVLNSPITGYKNIAYSLHFYANTHTQWLRDRLTSCLDKGLCVVATEFGTCDASGNGGFNKTETDKWMTLLKNRKVGFFNWSLSNKDETASAFLPGTDLSKIKSGTSQLTQSGKLIRSWAQVCSTSNPSGISYATVNNNAIYVKLTDTGADFYKVWVADNKNFQNSAYQELKGKTDTTFKNLAKKGAVYYVKTQGAKKLNGKWYYSDTFTKAITLAPNVSKTTFKKITPSANSLSVELNQNKSVTGYKVWVSDNKDFNNAKSVTTKDNTKTKVTFKNLTSDKAYYVKVQSYIWHKNGVRTQAAFSSAVTSSVRTNPNPKSPTVATDKCGRGYASIRINFAKQNGVTGYRMWASDNKNFNNKIIVDSSKPELKVTGLKPGTKYYFKACTYITRNGKRYYSKSNNFTYNTKALAKPVVEAKSVTGKSVSVKLKTTPYVGYALKISTRSDMTNYSLIRSSKPSLSFSNLRPETLYYVRAYTYVTSNKKNYYSAPVIFTMKTGKASVENKNGLTYVNGILIANKNYSLTPSYNPGGLTSAAYKAFCEMQKAAKKDGIDLWICSGFRSYETQKYLYESYVLRDGQEAADRYSARPGYSEHQTGLAIDINNASRSFVGTKEAKWIEKHCAEYGFLLRYPKNKESVTGYMYEPWHVRYLGKELAKNITNSKLTLEEYLRIV